MTAKLSSVPLCWTYRTIIAETGSYQLAIQLFPQASKFYIPQVLLPFIVNNVSTFYCISILCCKSILRSFDISLKTNFNSAKCQNQYFKDKNSVGSYLAEKDQMASEDEVFNSMISCSVDRQDLWCAAIKVNCNQIISVYFYPIVPTVCLNLSQNKLHLQTVLRQELIATYFRQN